MSLAVDQKEFEIDLPSQSISVSGEKIGFEIEDIENRVTRKDWMILV